MLNCITVSHVRFTQRSCETDHVRIEKSAHLLHVLDRDEMTVRLVDPVNRSVENREREVGFQLLGDGEWFACLSDGDSEQIAVHPVIEINGSGV